MAGGPSRREPSVNPAIPLGIGIAAVVLVALLGARLISHPKPVEPVVAAPPPQIEVPAPAVDPNSLLPHATEAAPEIATVAEMSKPWTSKSFFFVNHLTGENVPAMLIRLPQGSPNQRGRLLGLRGQRAVWQLPPRIHHRSDAPDQRLRFPARRITRWSAIRAAVRFSIRRR